MRLFGSRVERSLRATSAYSVRMRPQVSIDHCVIHVSDWQRSNAFYRDVAGAEVIERPGAKWAYRFGNQQLNVHSPGLDIDLVARLPVQPGNSDLCFVWPGPIDEAVAHLAEHEIAIVAGPMARHDGRDLGTSVYFRDPDGSLIEFISYT